MENAKHVFILSHPVVFDKSGLKSSPGFENVQYEVNFGLKMSNTNHKVNLEILGKNVFFFYL